MKKVVIKNKYDEIVCELESTGMFYRVKNGECELLTKLLEVGDTFKVVETEEETREEK